MLQHVVAQAICNFVAENLPMTAERAIPRWADQESNRAWHAFPLNFQPVLDLPSSDCVILGDLNGHSLAWNSPLAEHRSEEVVAGLIDQTNLCIINGDAPTRLPSNGAPSSPDISLISAHLATSVSWEAWTTGNSDHIPLTISYIDNDGFPDIPRFRRSYTNFRLADWDKWKEEVEERVSRLPAPSNASTGEKAFRRVLLDASRRHIPTGYHKSFRPSLCPEARDLMKERDSRRARDPADPSLEALQARIDSRMPQQPGGTRNSTSQSIKRTFPISGKKSRPTRVRRPPTCLTSLSSLTTVIPTRMRK